eukprot:jgi/Ulvmu1/4353/UM002_0078.1
MSITGGLGIVSGLVINLCSFLLPGYFSFRSLESHSHVETWFTYWVVFSIFSVVEHWLWFLLSRIPGYPVAKIAMICWLQFSNAQGAQLVYRRLLLPALRQYQPTIDRYLEMGESSVRKQMTQLGLQPGGQRADQATGVESLSQPMNRFGAGSSQAADIESAEVGKVS